MRHFLVIGMNNKRTEEVEKIRENLNLKLSFQTHRCEWCDFIKDVKENRKHRLEQETLRRTQPLTIKKNQSKE